MKREPDQRGCSKKKRRAVPEAVTIYVNTYSYLERDTPGSRVQLVKVIPPSLKENNEDAVETRPSRWPRL